MYTEICSNDRNLRPYQQAAKEQIFQAWDTYVNVMFQMPTGTGKTRLFTSIIGDIKTWAIRQNMDFKILIIAHRVELIEQISESLSKYKIAHGVIAGGWDRNLSPQVQVASIQTIMHHSNIDLTSNMNVGFIIIDEAHHSVANSYKKLWSFFPDSKKLGVTATPWRMNGSGFGDLYQHLVLSQHIAQFISEGWLSPYDYYSININSALRYNIDSIDEFESDGDYKISALERVIDNTKIRAQLLDSYLKFANGKKGIIYAISRKHSEHVCQVFQDAGIKIVRIDSQTPRNERRLYVNRFKEGKIDIIVNVDIFSEGFDCPDIEFVQLARPTRSLVKFLQQVGRGLRPTPNKSRCVILDNVGVYSMHGLPDSDRDWYSSFIGEEISVKPKTPSVHASHTNTHQDSNFDEGNEDLTCINSTDIQNAISDNSTSSSFVWNEEDEKLLNILVKDKQCPIEILTSIFKCTQDELERKIADMGL